MPRPRTLAEFRQALPQERFAAYRLTIRERLGLDLERTPTRLLDSTQIAQLAGVQPGTVTQWKMRTRTGSTAYPFLEPHPDSYQGKKLYDPYDVCAWLEWAHKWPPLSAARPQTRGPREERAPAAAQA